MRGEGRGMVAQGKGDNILLNILQAKLLRIDQDMFNCS